MTDEIIFEKRGKAGFVTLNRPKALNALTPNMSILLSKQLKRWEHDSEIAHVVITGTGEKAFCAGGDIRGLYEAKLAGEDTALYSFFKDEYKLNAQIKSYPKPYIALINGIVMGGGVGVSVHGTHRVGTERAIFAMPETGIGFFPDVGGTYFLPRMPKKSGLYCALSAGRLKQAGSLATGILTHAISNDSLPDLEKELEKADDVTATIAAYESEPDAGPIAAYFDLIDKCFSAPSVEAILSELDKDGSEFALKTATAIRGKAPMSLLVAFEQLKRGASLSFNESMQLEYRIVSRFLNGSDFYEGIRALVIDKDQKPKWRPSSLDQVDSEELASYFQEPEEGDLVLP